MKPIHHMRDPSRLTPMEERIYALMKEGLTNRQMAERLGSSSASSMACRVKVIREKLAAQLMPTG